MRIPLTRPYITQHVKEAVTKVLDSGFLTEGKVAARFEEAVRKFLGVRNVIAVCNCTAGLELALRCLGIGSGDEVIVPSFTYPASGAVVGMVGAGLKLVDIDRRTMLMDYDRLVDAITPRTRAIMPVSLFGNPPDYDRLLEIKTKFGLYIIEDAACALGAAFKDRRIGGWADITVFSLHPRKFITTGEGGLIATGNDKWAAWLNSYKRFGIRPDAPRDRQFAMAGGNYKLSDIQAAVGLAQMDHIDTLLSERIAAATRYREMLVENANVKIQECTPGGRHSYQSFCISAAGRDNIIDTLRAHGVETQIGTYALHRQPAFVNNANCDITTDLPNSDDAYARGLVLPLYAGISVDEQTYVVSRLEKAIAH